MAENNFFYLIKEIIIPKTQNGFVDVENGNFQSVPSVAGKSNGTAGFAKQVLEYIHGQPTVSKQIYLGVFNSGGRPTDNTYEVWVRRELLDMVYKLVPTAFLKVVVTVDYSENVGQITYNKRFDASELWTRAPSFWTTQPLFSTNGATVEKDSTVDIILGWSESNNSRLKLSTDVFLQNLFQKESSKDLILVAGNGAELKCHRIVFEAHSDVLTAMLSLDNGMLEAKSGRVEIKENSEEAVTHLINYLYGMELNAQELSCEITIELFILAHKYDLKDLEERLCNFILERGSEWFNPDALLELYFHVKNLDDSKSLTDHLLRTIIRLSVEVRNCERFRELNRTDLPSVVELLWKLLELVNNAKP